MTKITAPTTITITTPLPVAPTSTTQTVALPPGCLRIDTWASGPNDGCRIPVVRVENSGFYVARPADEPVPHGARTLGYLAEDGTAFLSDDTAENRQIAALLHADIQTYGLDIHERVAALLDRGVETGDFAGRSTPVMWWSGDVMRDAIFSRRTQHIVLQKFCEFLEEEPSAELASEVFAIFVRHHARYLGGLLFASDRGSDRQKSLTNAILNEQKAATAAH